MLIFRSVRLKVRKVVDCGYPLVYVDQKQIGQTVAYVSNDHLPSDDGRTQLSCRQIEMWV